MIKYSLIGLFVLIPVFSSYGQGKWEVLHESDGEMFLFLDFISESKGWKVDTLGVCTTDDGGANWTRIWEQENVVDLDFKNESSGWVVVGEPGGVKIVYQTTDAGKNWDIIGKCNDAHRILVISDTLQYSYSDHSILRTNNGIDWEFVLRIGGDNYINQLVFLNTDTGVCVTKNQIHRTFDGGNSWSAVDIPYDSVWRIKFIGDSMGYLFASLSDAPILFSSDFFDSSIEIPKPETEIFEIHFFSEDTIIANAGDSWFYQSNNRGKTWQKISSRPILYGGWGSVDTEMHIFGNSIFLICRWQVDFLFMSKDRGVHWQQMNMAFPLVDVHFVSPEKGFLVGYYRVFHSISSYLAVSENGGENWISLTNPSLYATDVYFLNDSVGFFGVNLESRDGGQTWNWRDEEVKIIFSPNDPFDWMASFRQEEDETSILRSKDGGLSWQTVYNLKEENLLDSDMMFINSENAGFAINNAMLVKFSREGTKDIDLGMEIPLQAIWFMDENRGIITGGYRDDMTYIPVILRTHDGGESWEQDPDPQYLIYDLYFLDSLQGFAVGENQSGHGVLLESINRGETWDEVDLGIDSLPILRAMNFCGGWGWAVGHNSFILRYEPEHTGMDPSHLPDKKVINLYPNPMTSMFTLELERPIRGELEIYNINGAMILKRPIQSTSEQIDISSFSKGVYFVTVRSKEFVRTEKIVKL